VARGTTETRDGGFAETVRDREPLLRLANAIAARAAETETPKAAIVVGRYVTRRRVATKKIRKTGRHNTACARVSESRHTTRTRGLVMFQIIFQKSAASAVPKKQCLPKRNAWTAVVLFVSSV